MEHAVELVEQALQDGINLAELTKAICEKATQLHTTEAIADVVKTTFAEHNLTVGGRIKKKRRVYWTQKNPKKKVKNTNDRLPTPPNETDNTDSTETPIATEREAELNSVDQGGDVSDDMENNTQRPESDPESGLEIENEDTGAFMSPASSPTWNLTAIAVPEAVSVDRVSVPVERFVVEEENVGQGIGQRIGQELEIMVEGPRRDAWDDETLVNRFWNDSKTLPTIQLTDKTAANFLEMLDNKSLATQGFYATYASDHQNEAPQTLGQSAAKMLNGERSTSNLAAILTYYSYIGVWERCAKKNPDKGPNSYDIRRARDAKLAKYDYFDFTSERVFKNCANTGLRLVSFLEYICTYNDAALLTAAKRFINYIPTKMIYEEGSEENWAAYVMEWTSYKIPIPSQYKTMKPQYHFDVASRAEHK